MFPCSVAILGLLPLFLANHSTCIVYTCVVGHIFTRLMLPFTCLRVIGLLYILSGLVQKFRSWAGSLSLQQTYYTYAFVPQLHCLQACSQA